MYRFLKKFFLDYEIKECNRIYKLPFCTVSKVDELGKKRCLVINNIPTLWSNASEECTSSSLEYHYAADILPIPVDQRYGTDDMKYLAEVIKSVLFERT